MTERWFLTKVFYSLSDLDTELDPHGDTILVEFVRPVLAHLYQQGWIRWGTFMRFSEQGYHIRFLVYGDETTLAEHVQPYVQAALAAHRAEHPEIALNPMSLAPLAVRLNQKWGGPKESFDLHSPSADIMGLMYNTGEDEIFESDAAFASNYDLHSDACNRILEFLAARPSHKLRKTFVRLLMDDILRAADMTNLERYYFLTFLQMQWIDYFDLEPQVFAPYHALYVQMKDRYQQFFSAKRGPEDSLPLLPAPVHAMYLEWVSRTSAYANVPAFMGRDGQGALTPHGSLRLLSLFHLVHNRIGVGLLQEIFLAYILAQHYRTFLTSEEIAAADAWSRSMRTLEPNPA
jgi:hypothetical protein